MRRDYSRVLGDTQIRETGVSANGLDRLGKTFDGDGYAGNAAIFGYQTCPRTRGRAAPSSAVSGDDRVAFIQFQFLRKLLDHP